MVSAEASERSLEFSPTWALAAVATVFVVISYIVERLLHRLGHVRASKSPHTSHWTSSENTADSCIFLIEKLE